ncbi:MAG: cobalt transporter CbiM [Candidatus Adiutrix sp.]|jgi:cobalt/nickel transport system permease protein|nr:cobalt transporter CbiM [Candidatus Adiutrix sp.]
MHISEGVLSAPVILGGAALALAGTARGLKGVTAEELPRASLLAAVFFTASLIHVRVGPAATHLVLSGLIGLMLGWAAFPVILIGLLLQGLLFQYGGLSTLGVNTFNMAGPAVLLGALLRRGLSGPGPKTAAVCGLVCGGGSILLSALLVALCLYLSGDQFAVFSLAVVGANLPIVVIEALVTMFCVQFLRQVRPGLLKGPAVKSGPGPRS